MQGRDEARASADLPAPEPLPPPSGAARWKDAMQTDTVQAYVKYSAPSVFGVAPLKKDEVVVDGRIRTACLAVIAITCLCLAVFYLQEVLVPFVLALALKFLLTPIIDFFSCAGCATPGGCKLPRGIATILSFVIVIYAMGFVVSLVTNSATRFVAKADVYTQRLSQLLDMALEASNSVFGVVGQEGASIASIEASVKNFLANVSVTDVILSVIGEVGHIAESALYIILFLAFLLAGKHGAAQPDEPAPVRDKVAAMAEKRVYQYIRGKVSISAFVAVVSGGIYWTIGVDLWLVFAILAFWLNFVPNVGMGIAVIIPMPLIALDPKFSPLTIAFAFVGPFAVGTVAKDVLEPLLVGNAVALQPIAVLMAIMLWGSAWGITGAILAVPLTAVIRIYLAGIHHPLPRYIATMLSGEEPHAAASAELL